MYTWFYKISLSLNEKITEWSHIDNKFSD
jgi:hypothetical protein